MKLVYRYLKTQKKIALFFVFLPVVLIAQNIKGNFSDYAGQELKLKGFDNFRQIDLSVTRLDSMGNFSLIYPLDYKGLGVLMAEDNSSLVFALTEPDLKINGTYFKDRENLKFLNSRENQLFFQYESIKSEQQQFLPAFEYLLSIYKKKEPFSNRKKIVKTLSKEKERLKNKEADFLNSVDKESYFSWFLPLRNLVKEMNEIAKLTYEKKRKYTKQFRSINFKNPNFKRSGLLKDLVEKHFIMLENTREPQDSMYSKINVSIKFLVDELSNDDTLLNAFGSHLFQFLERRSLFKSSEYLATLLLTNKDYNLDSKLISMLEVYRKLKPKNIAPEIYFSDGTKLSDINKNILLVFGSSWCPECNNDISKLLNGYKTWKDKDIELVYISIDKEAEAFKKTFKNIPWKTYCDFKGWEGKAVKDYCVLATPTYFLLDKDLKILLKPNSIEHIKSWVNYKMTKP